ncbi:Lrp/AsnC family transcriptional regulator [Sphingomonas ginkgonis]|uniref:Lrp/AsnC family transcriptional regulator n=1 Tax=Sphingomonas ginkgonis TaxID=2315330 RepID=A0A3S0EMG5_9SPHN|nr:Lrp/AsnC family transcriptional regulator [Sphingomonas ginkgonis]RST30925.1 Lrp/AsnC family transcriptional regulator [Sphingomonas ginkgonis]
MAGEQLDPLDRRILAVLQRRGDISQADLAAEVAASPASCWRRIRAMEQAGVLGATVRLVNAAAVGRELNAICQVRMKAHSSEVRQSFEAFVLAQPEVLDCWSMSGEWDYLLRVSVARVADYEDFLMHRLLNHPAVANSASQFALKTVKNVTSLPV